MAISKVANEALSYLPVAGAQAAIAYLLHNSEQKDRKAIKEIRQDKKLSRVEKDYLGDKRYPGLKAAGKYLFTSSAVLNALRGIAAAAH